MNLHQLRLFCAVVERGSFVLASRELFVSQPALSIQIQRLERALGLTLLQRSRGGVVPTPAGREVYAAASGLVEHVASVERQFAALRSGEAGTLAVGASPTGALYVLAALVEAFQQAQPEVQVSVEVESEQRLFERVRAGSLDAGLDRGPTVPPGLCTTTLLDEPFGVVASPRHPAAANGRIGRNEFLRTPLFLLQHAVPGPTYMESWLLARELLPARVTRLPYVDAVKRLVEANLGLTILSRSVAARELAAGRLVWLELDGFQLTRPLVWLTRKGPLSPLLARLLAFASGYAAHSVQADPMAGEANALE